MSGYVEIRLSRSSHSSVSSVIASYAQPDANLEFGWLVKAIQLSKSKRCEHISAATATTRIITRNGNCARQASSLSAQACRGGSLSRANNAASPTSKFRTRFTRCYRTSTNTRSRSLRAHLSLSPRRIIWRNAAESRFIPEFGSSTNETRKPLIIDDQDDSIVTNERARAIRKQSRVNERPLRAANLPFIYRSCALYETQNSLATMAAIITSIFEDHAYEMDRR